MDIRRRNEKEYIVLRKAAKVSGYSSDYIGYLIRKGKIKGKRIFSNTSWQIALQDLIKYCEKKKNLGSRDSSLLKKKHLSLKEAAEVSGYAPDYIGYLIRTGKISGKKVYSSISLVTTEKEIRKYKEKKKLRASELPLIPSWSFRFPLRVPKYAVIFAILGIIIFSGLIVWAITPKSPIQTVEIHFTQYAGDPPDGEAGWENPQNTKGPPEVLPEGDLDSFSEANSAVYKGGPLSLVLSGFNKTRTDLATETQEEQAPEQPLEEQPEEQIGGQQEQQLQPESEEPSQSEEESAQQETEGEPAEFTPILEETSPEIPPIESASPPIESISPPQEGIGGKETELPEEKPASFFEKIKNFFGNLTAKAQEIPTFEQLNETQFQSAKIKFSFAIGEKIIEFTPILEESSPEIELTPEPLPSIETTTPPTSFWNRAKNFFKTLIVKAKAIIVKAKAIISRTVLDTFVSAEEISPIETVTPPIETLPDLDTKIIIWYSLDGENWWQLDTISSYPLSNFLNDGYFSYDAPFLENWGDVKNLKIKFEGVIGGETNVIAYLDSVWVEVTYKEQTTQEEQPQEQPSETFPEPGESSEEIPPEVPQEEVPEPLPEEATEGTTEEITEEIEEPPEEEPVEEEVIEEEEKKEEEQEKIELLSEKDDFQLNEEPEFRFRYKKISANLSTCENVNVKAQLKGPKGEVFVTWPRLFFKNNGEILVKLKKPREVEPGLYRITLKIEDNGHVEEFEQVFTWGVLAINVNKSIYLPGERVYIQMAVLDNLGHTVCDADLMLSIKYQVSGMEKILSTEDGTIQRSSECGPNSVTNIPDYYTYYNVGDSGVYELNLTATTKEGTHSISDSFEVREWVPFDVERIGPTRIWPMATYEMILKIKANQEFIGDVIDTVPSSFEIPTNNKQYTINNNNNGDKALSWQNVTLQQGDDLELKYTFDAPDISPYLYLLGPLTINETGSRSIFEERRQWQIAADAPDVITNSPSANTGDWANPTNAYASNNTYADSSTAKGVVHTWYNYGFSLTGSSITKVEVGIEGYGGDSSNYITIACSWDGGESWTSEQSYVLPASDPGTPTYIDLTNGRTWTPDELSNTNFRVRVTEIDAGGPTTLYIDWIPVRVTYTPPFTPKLHNWRWYGNDGAEPTTALAGQNVKPTGIDINDILRLRVDIHETGNVAGSNQDLVVEYSDDQSTWYSLGGQGATDKLWRWYDGLATAGNTITGYKLDCGDEAGKYHEAECTDCVDIGASKHHEMDITIQNYNAEGITYYFRIKLEGSALPLEDPPNAYPQVEATVWTTLTQRQGILENDEDSSNISNPHTAEIGERIRVKIQIDTGSGGAARKVLKLQYSQKQGAACGGGDETWYDVRPSGEIRAVPSIIVKSKATLGGPDAGTCTGGTTWRKGIIYEGRAFTDAYKIYGSTCQEIAFVLDTKNATANIEYCFRLYNVTDNSTLTEIAYPSFTTVTSANNTKNYSKTNLPNLPSGSSSSAYDDLRYLLDKLGYGNVNADDAAREILQNVVNDTTADIISQGEGTNNSFGYSVSSAGDVNGDGFADVIVGAYGADKAYIYYGGSSMDNTADVTMTGEADSEFGKSVSSAGDVNGDGYSDVIVGAYKYNFYTGRAYIYYGGTSMDNTADVTMTGETTNDDFGGSVSSAGDINGDGYDDVIVGAFTYNAGIGGRVYIFYGDPSMDNTADVTMDGEGTDDYFGASVSSAGDVNGDGYPDVIVGAELAGSGGRAYIFYGGPSMDNTADVTIDGEAALDNFGKSVSSAGDVNGDGYDDVIVGANLYDVTESEGRAYIYYGASSMDNTADVTMTGEATTNYFGGSVSSAGDVNGDGFSDVIVGAYGYSASTGRAYIFYGASSMDNTADVTMDGEGTDDRFGISVSSAGDVNGDGYPDVIVGAYGYNSWTGRAYIYLFSYSANNTADKTMTGKAANNEFGISVSQAGDVNGDGYPDVIVGAWNYNSITGRAYIFYGGSSMDNTADVTMTGEATNNSFGISVSQAGDVNGDGYSDVIVGAYGYSSSTGRAYIFYGAPSMDNTADVTMTGENTNDRFGYSVSQAGDVNGDGFGDVVVGAWNYNSITGRAYIFYGSSSMDNTADLIMTGETTSNEFGWSVSEAGDVNGDGFGDVIVGAYGYSSDTGRAYIFYGGSSMDNTADLTMTGETTSNEFGWSVSEAGDVNGDGFGDVIVGADNYSSYTGRAYIYYGGASMDNTADLTMTGEATNNSFGISVSQAGDVNGDGFSDVIVGANGYSTNTGRAYLYIEGGSTFYPIFNFISKSSYACSELDEISPTWNGQSSVDTSGNNVKLEVYNFNSSSWSTQDTESTEVADTDFNLTATLTENLSYYCDGSNWTYWRVQQAIGTETLRSDYWTITFTGPWTTLNQRQGILENDEDSSNISTPHTAQIGERIRVKIQIDTDSGGAARKVLKLQYAQKQGAACGGGDETWYDVRPAGEIRAVPSIIVKDKYTLGGPDAGTCTGGTTWNKGIIYEGRAFTDAYKIYGSTCQEVAFIVDTKNATANIEYCFRLYNVTDNSTLTEIAYPSFTTVTSANNTKNYSKTNLPNLPSGSSSSAYDDLRYLLDDLGYSNVNADDSAREILQNIVNDTTADIISDGEATDNYFGYSVSEAGDVNGDGFPDVIVGAYGYDTNTGRAYIYYGASSMDNTADVTMDGEATSNYFGWSVSQAGDVNGDGYSDVIVGAPYYSTETGRAYIYYGGSSMDNTADVTMDGEATDNYFGYSVSEAGDVNGDGYPDVIVGAYRYDVVNDEGRAYIYYGGSSMDNTADVTMTGEATDNYFGRSVSQAGDVNGDGFPDVIVGADRYNPNGASNTGRAYIYYGASSMDNTADVTMTGEATDNYFGRSVSQAGDVNGDGFPDVIVGAYGYSANTGRAYIYYGGSSMDNTADVTMTGENTGDYFGRSVSQAGDVNGDGFPDVIVGAYGYSTWTGRAYIYYGASSMDNTADVTMTGEATDNYFGRSVSQAGDVNGDGYSDVIVGAYAYSSYTGRAYIYLFSYSADNTADKIMTGETTNNRFGYSVSSAGDVNGDGFGDVIIGAYAYSTNTGRAYIYYGSSSMDNTADVIMDAEGSSHRFGYSVSQAGDVNGDGFGDVIIGAYQAGTGGRAYIYYGGTSMDNTADVTMDAEAANISFGRSVSQAGDVNGDGFPDVIVGAYGYSSLTGRAYIFYGASSMDNTADVTMTGEDVSNDFGYSVSSAGDVNGDGFVDVIIGARQYSSYTGRAYIYYGASSMDNTADVTMTGEATDSYFGWSVSSAGDVNGDGFPDVVVGSSNYSSFAGRAYIFYGASSMDNTADVTMDGPGGGSLAFGRSVSSAGDVNGDGYSDVIVGAPNYLGGTGRAYIFYGASSMDNTADVTMTGEAGNNYFGASVSSAGDVNGDGYLDVIVGAYGYSGAYTGRAYIYIEGGSTFYPIFNFTSKSSFACSELSEISPTWNGQSSVDTSGNNVKLQVYNFNSSSWSTQDTESTEVADTDFNLTATLTENLSYYCDGSNWSYWRVQQAIGTETLRSDYWTITFTPGVPIDISGRVCSAEPCNGSNGISPCNGVATNVGLSVEGGAPTYVDCDSGTGAFLFSSVSIYSGQTATLFINEETEDATLVMVVASSTISDADFYENKIVVRAEISTIGTTEMAKYDSGDQANDIRFQAVANTSVTLEANNELHVWTDDTFDPNGTVTTNATGGDLHCDDSATCYLDTTGSSIGRDALVDGSATLNFQGTGASHTIGRNITTSGTGAIITYTNSPTVTMSGTGNIGGGTTPSITFYNLFTSGTGTTVLVSSATADNNVTVGTGTTLDVTADLNVGANFTNTTTGIITTTGGTPTVTMSGTGNLGGGSGNITFHSLATSGTGTITFSGSGTNTVNNDVTVGTGTTLNINSDISITGSLTNTTTGIIGTSAGTPTVTVSGTSIGGGSGAITFYNLTKAGAGTTTFSGSGTNAVNNNLNVNAGTFTLSNTLTVTGDGAVATGATFNINANLNIDGGGLTTTDTGVIDYTSGTPTVDIDETGTLGGGGGSITFYSLDLGDGTVDTTTLSSTIIIDNNLTINASQTFTVGSNSVTVGSSETDSGGISVATGASYSQTGGTTIVKSSASGVATIGGAGTTTFYNFTVGTASDNTTYTFRLGGNITVSNNILIADGGTGTHTLEVSSAASCGGTISNITVGGSWDNNDTFTRCTGTVTFDAGTTGKTISDGGSAFYDIEFTGSGGGWEYIDSASSAINTTSVSAGTADYLNVNHGAISVTGGTLNVDWYLGTHVVDASDLSNIDTGNSDITISENSVITQTETLRPNAAGSVTQLTPSGCTNNFECVDDTGSGDGNDTTVKNLDDVSSTKYDLYEVPNTAIPSGSTINSVTIYMRERNIVDGVGHHYTMLKTNGTEYPGTVHDPPPTYTLYSQVYTQNPYTESAWTIEEINAMQIGVKLVTEYDAVFGWTVGFSTQVYVEVNYDGPLLTVWRYNAGSWGSEGTGWESPATSKNTGTNSDGKNPQPYYVGAIRIREYSMTSSSTCPGAGCTLYKYNLQIVWQTNYGEYDYYADYGENYLTSCWAGSTNACSNDTADDDVIGSGWYRSAPGTMNDSPPYSGLNDPPTQGSWYIGMLAGLSFSIDDVTVDIGELNSLNDFTASAYNTLTVTSSATNGTIITAYETQEMTLVSDSTTVVDWPYDYSNPNTWTDYCMNSSEWCGFGFSSSDTEVGGQNRYDGGNKYAGFPTNDPANPIRVADISDPANAWAEIITYKISVSFTQEMGQYQTTIIYVLTAQY